jgi:hypothetical protein
MRVSIPTGSPLSLRSPTSIPRLSHHTSPWLMPHHPPPFPSLLSSLSPLWPRCSVPLYLISPLVQSSSSSPHLDSDISVLYLALILIGDIVSPANQASSYSEILHQITLYKPSIAFSVSSMASEISSQIPIILLGSLSFIALLSSNLPNSLLPVINQSDHIAIGHVKGVRLTH